MSNPESELDATVRRLPLTEKAAQVLVTAVRGASLGEFEAAGPAGGWSMPPGGIILYKSNLASGPGAAGRLREFLDGLQRRATGAAPHLGLLVTIDHEGGRFTHLGGLDGFTEFPGNMALGAIADRGGGRTAAKAAARAAAEAMGEELAAVGVHLDYAPVLDVNNNPANPIIGERAYGEDPEAVADLGEAACQGFADGGLLACGKHFPGHGDTDADSHRGLPRLPYGPERLREVELVPFRRAIRAGVPSIMTAHIVYPAADPSGLPATLSPAVVDGLLRRQLGFGGAVITDALEMRAIADGWGMGEAAVLSLMAGVDVVLLSKPGNASPVRAAIIEAIEAGRLPQARLDEAVRRMLELKMKAGLLQGGAGPRADAGGDRERLAASIAARSVTLVRNLAGLLPLDPAADAPWTVISPVPGLAEALGRLHPRTEDLPYSRPEEARRLAAQIPRAPEAQAPIFIATRVTGGVAPAGAAGLPSQGATPGGPADPDQREMALAVEALLASGRPLVWVALGTPYELALVAAAPTYLATYSTRRPSLEALAAIVTGRSLPAGRLPVTIPGLYPAGHGFSKFGRGG